MMKYTKRNPHYGIHITKRVHDAWVRISVQAQFPVEELKKRKDSLIATYRGQLREIKNSFKSGAGCEEVLFEPIWFTFDSIDPFLGHLYKCKRTINTENKVHLHSNPQ